MRQVILHSQYSYAYVAAFKKYKRNKQFVNQ